MAAAYDAISGVSQSGNGTITLSHTCTGSNLLLLVGIANDTGGSAGISGVTYNGVAMTSLTTINNTDSLANIRISVYYLIAPATGAHNIVVTRTGPPITNSSVAGISFTGIDQTTPLGTAATATQNNGSSPSVTVSGATGNIIVDFHAVLNSPTTATVGASQTERKKLLVSGGTILCSTEAGASSVVMDWSLGANKWSASIGVAVKPVAAGGSNNLTGSSAGAATASGTLSITKKLLATVAGVAVAVGTLAVKKNLSGSSAGVSSAVGTLLVKKNLTGSSAGVGTASGTLAVSKNLSGSSAGVATASGTLLVKKNLSGSTAGVGTATGTLSLTRNLTGSTAGIATASGTLTNTPAGSIALNGSTAGVGAASGSLLVKKNLTGSSAGTGAASGTLLVKKNLSGSTAGAGVATGTLTNVPGSISLTGTAAGTSTATATLSGNFESTKVDVTVSDAPVTLLTVSDAPLNSLGVSDAVVTDLTIGDSTL